MQFIISHDHFEGDAFDSVIDIEAAITDAINNGHITVSEAEDLEICKIERCLSATINVSVSVDIG